MRRRRRSDASWPCRRRGPCQRACPQYPQAGRAGRSLLEVWPATVAQREMWGGGGGEGRARVLVRRLVEKLVGGQERQGLRRQTPSAAPLTASQEAARTHRVGLAGQWARGIARSHVNEAGGHDDPLGAPLGPHPPQGIEALVARHLRPATPQPGALPERRNRRNRRKRGRRRRRRRGGGAPPRPTHQWETIGTKFK